MSTASQATGDDTTQVPTPAGGLLTARGETTISPVVVEKIATRAATEVDGVGGVVKTGLGRLLPWVSDDSTPQVAQATADVERDSVAVELTVNVRYPEPVSQVTGRLRDHVVQRLAELTGFGVREVNITVDELVVERPRSRPRVQ